MKKIINIIKEYPLAAFLCAAADIAVTCYFTAASMKNDPTEISYFIALYGALMGMLILAAGWSCAASRAEKKAAQRRRIERRNAITAMYREEFYSITENLT